MKALLTGITGNVGYEVSLDLIERGISVIPCVRPGSADSLSSHPAVFAEVVEHDLVEGGILNIEGTIDCIVHCAGVVHFRKARNQNAAMMTNVLEIAQRLDVPVYCVSTAFVYRPEGTQHTFNNSYEKDKYDAEVMLTTSKVPHAILRPSVLVGHSRTGAIQNFSGYYTVVRAFISAIEAARANNRLLRIPRMTGESNMVPIDEAAHCIGSVVEDHQRGLFYVTNPNPPRSEWVLEETLNFFALRDTVTVMDVSFEDFSELALTEEEQALHTFSAHFNPYWSTEYSFPATLSAKNLIDREYLTRALTFFRESAQFLHGPKAH